MNFKLKVLPAVILAAGLVAATQPAVAADTTYTLGIPNAALSTAPAPYADVAIHLNDSTHALVTFTALDTGGWDYLFGDGGSVDVNVNALSWTISAITGTTSLSGFAPGPLSSGGSGNVSTFGTFNQTVNSFDGFLSSSEVISFTLTNTGGTWANSSSVLIANTKGQVAAAHIFACDYGTCTDTGGATVTGFASDGALPPTAIPEPETYAMMLAGLGLMGFVARRRRPNGDMG